MSGSTDSLVRLRAGALEVLLAPAIGGSIARFDRLDGETRAPILRGCEGYPRHVLDTGSFPLVPYANRIRGGRFAFDGQEIRLAPNLAGDPSPLHGGGWLAPWRLDAADERAALMVFDHIPGEWPWAYQARQTFTLTDTELTVVLECRNVSNRAMPCGLGQHPFFPCGPATRIDTTVEQVWTIDADILPTGTAPATGRFDLRSRLVCGQGLDHGFDGWGGAASLTDPGWPYVVRMSSPTARYFQLYSPAAGGLIAAEPVAHANAALNAPREAWPGLGIEVLEPGAATSLTMTIEVLAAA